MKKRIIIAFCLLILCMTLMIPLSVLANDDPAVLSAAEFNWGTDLDNIVITIKTNKDVDQIVLSSGQGDLLLTPETNYTEEDLRGNNEAMDMNGDLEVDQKDYDILKKHVDGTEPGKEKEGCKQFTATVRCSHCGAADIDGDGKIGASDLTMLQSHLDGKCTLDDCYFHGKRTYREETEDEYIWTVHYTPTIAGIDIMTITPQSVTSTGTRNGESSTLEIKAEEFKDPEILSYGLVPNQDKYLVFNKSSVPVTIFVVTPLETDKVKFQIKNQLLLSDITEAEVTEWESIDYDKCEKTWKYVYTTNNRGWRDITITGYGEQSEVQGGWIEGTPVSFQKRIVDPQVTSCNTTTVPGWLEVWYTYSSSTDAKGNTTTSSTRHERQWYDHTTTAICNNDTDYVFFSTSGGSGYNYGYSESGDSRTFQTSWTDLSGSGSGSAYPYATISVYPSEF
ncbi:dockerin type I repeat-containing protein [Acetobacterium wieringae]|uniref:dockerin type I repeat-containing protein n=1 Tax=Acetobacterium wieringae TaxID=52694 RepID=UPI002B1F96CB|nr:dockerin type I repeat-containing protein [Acetobacterium wieringae]MEA4805011.1 dockerin type I repeat-containing protein [Acetobacterium wieringae]